MQGRGDAELVLRGLWGPAGTRRLLGREAAVGLGSERSTLAPGTDWKGGWRVPARGEGVERLV